MKNLFSSVLVWLHSSEAVSRINTAALTFALSFSAGVSADDTELFFSAESAPPNILFVLDDSRSMETETGEGRTRMSELKLAMTSLVSELGGVNAGIVQFHRNTLLTAPIVPIGSEGIDANKQQLLDIVAALEPRTEPGNIGTATQAALWLSRRYFRGELEDDTGVYPSPIAHECQQNHVILMTDGRPTSNDLTPEVETTLGLTCDVVDVGTRTDNGTCGAEIGAHLFAADHNGGIDGLNNVVTHTIGFDFESDWLPSISGNTLDAEGAYTGGHGRHFNVGSADELLVAFNSIIEGVGATFAAPTVSPNSFNESRHRDELYFAQFESSSSVRWHGNIKKYKLNELPGAETVAGEVQTVIVDADNEPLIDAETGQINATSRSLWSAVDDGGSIPEGGFAHQLPAYDERNWYTDYNSTDPVKVAFNDVDLDAKIPVESLGAANEAERDTLVSWMLGFDVEGADTAVAVAANNAETAANVRTIAAAQAVDANAAAVAAAATLADAEAAEDAASIVALDAEAAANAAIAAGDPLAGALMVASDIAAADLAAAVAEVEAATIESDATNSVAVAANDAAATAAVDASASAAQEANAENNNFVADSLHNSPVLLTYFTTSNPVDRGEILFAANNLGVLHAIDPETGVELWSYTPEEHLGNIKAYFDNAQTQNHVYGLDGQFTLHTTRAERAGYDSFVDDAWLYMTERRGGNRVYALDVSNGLADPETADPFSVMWKITGGVDGIPVYDSDGDGRNDFADLAQTWSKPTMVTVNVGCPDSCETKDLLMFSGGYNADIYDNVNLDYGAFTVPDEGHGNAVYFVDPQTGALEWSVGKGPHHSFNLPMEHSIPSTPVPVDTDLDGSIDLLFFVDIAGDVWRVDIDDNAQELDELHLAGDKIAELSPTGQSLRFFNPIDVVVSGTNFSTAFFSLVTGSGIRSSPLFVEPAPNRLYSIVDRWVHQAPFRLDDDGNRVSDYRYVTGVGDDHRIISIDDDVLKNVSDPDSTISNTYGFFRTFEPGEKKLQPTLVHNNRIFSNSYVPPTHSGGVNCNFDIGTTRLYITSLLDGDNTIPPDLGGEYLEVGVGLLGPGQIVDTGSSGGPVLLNGYDAPTLKELTAPSNTEVFRRFRRTGWVELDEY